MTEIIAQNIIELQELFIDDIVTIDRKNLVIFFNVFNIHASKKLSIFCELHNLLWCVHNIESYTKQANNYQTAVHIF